MQLLIFILTMLCAALVSILAAAGLLYVAVYMERPGKHHQRIINISTGIGKAPLSSSPCFCCSPSDYPLHTLIPREVADYCHTAWPMTPYIPPSTLQPTDIVLLLLSMHTYTRTRGEYVMHSWVNQVKNPFAYFTCSVPRLHQPCLEIPHTDDSFLSNINKTMIGLREIYYLHPTAKWYWITSDDGYVNSHFMRKKLQELDSSKPFFVGGNLLPPFPCPHNGRNAPMFSGGGGHVISNQLMKETAAKMESWLLNEWRAELHGRGRSGGDVALSCFFAQLGYSATHLPGFAYTNPQDSSDEEGFYNKEHVDFHEERQNWHYVKGVELLHADIFFSLQMVDRMQRNNQLDLLATYAREMIIERFHVQNRSAHLLSTL